MHLVQQRLDMQQEYRLVRDMETVVGMTPRRRLHLLQREGKGGMEEDLHRKYWEERGLTVGYKVNK